MGSLTSKYLVLLLGAYFMSTQVCDVIEKRLQKQLPWREEEG